MKPPRVEARGLGLSFGPRTALREINLSLRMGESLALFGPNGAGKTTLLRILSTLLRPTRGTVRLAGLDLGSRENRVAARRRVGVLLHQTMLYDQLTALENLLFYARMYRVPSAGARCLRLLAEVGLAGREEDPVRDYSHGMRQRLAIARAQVHDPDLLLLDEPFTGLDPQAAGFLSGLLAGEISRGKTLLFTSHDLEAGLSLCHRAAILSRGALVFDAPRDRIEPGRFAAIYEAAVGPSGPTKDGL